MYPNLDAEMARRKMTRAELADRLKRTRATISLKLNGDAKLTLEEAFMIKNELDTSLSLDELFSKEAM